MVQKRNPYDLDLDLNIETHRNLLNALSGKWSECELNAIMESENYFDIELAIRPDSSLRRIHEAKLHIAFELLVGENAPFIARD